MASSCEKWKFHAHPMMANRHTQTVLGINWPRKYAPYTAKRHFVPLSDGDRIALHEEQPQRVDESLPIVLLVHGLAGCHTSTYMCRMVEKLGERGYRSFRMDMRGCGAGIQVASKPTHCGRWQDMASVLEYIAELYPDAKTNLVTFSMSGTLALNMLAEAGEMRVGTLERSFLVSPPIDLVEIEKDFRTGVSRRYDKYLVGLLWKQNLQRWQQFPDVRPDNVTQPARRLRELDDLVIAPSGGYESTEAYYLDASPGPKLRSIRQPVTIFTSEDDPVVPIGPLMAAHKSDWVETISVSRGGHLGFMAARNGDPDFRWLDWRILDWVRAGHTADEVVLPPAAVLQTQPV